MPEACVGTELYPGLVVPKIYRPGLGYSTATGPQVGGTGLGPADAGGASPYKYSSTFFGSDVKQLFPSTFQFSKTKVYRSKKSKRSKRKSIRKFGSKKARGSKRTSRKIKRSRK